MYRALYDYQSSLPGYLSFKAGDQFTVIEKTSDDWLLAQNGIGQVGFVPHNYVSGTKVRQTDTNPSACSLFFFLFCFFLMFTTTTSILQWVCDRRKRQ